MKFTSSLIIFLISFSFLTAQTTSTYNFLRLDVDARSAAMAGSFVSAENDVNSVFYNPAGISTLQAPQASIGFFKYLLDINSGNIAYSQKYKDLGYFGASLRFINYGTFDKYDENYENQGTFSANDMALTLTYSNTYIENLHYGIGLKFIYSNIGEYNSSAMALDLGLMYKIPSQKMMIGASLLNLGTQLKAYYNTSEKLPLDLKIGASKTLEHLPLTVSIAFNNLLQESNDFVGRFKDVTLGGEFIVSDNVDLRIGYNNQQRQDLKTGTAIGIGGFSAGLGLNYELKYFLDYSFNSMGKIGATHRINIRYYFLK